MGSRPTRDKLRRESERRLTTEMKQRSKGTNVNIEKAPQWTDAADAQGKAAYLAAEQRLRDAGTPADLAREPVPAELARLAELQADLDAALAQVDGAKAEMLAALPAVESGAIPLGGGLLGLRAVHGWQGGGRPDDYMKGQRALAKATELEGEARSAMTTYQLEVQAAGQRRYLAMTQKASSR